MEISDLLHARAQARHVAINTSFDAMTANIIAAINEHFARRDEQLRQAAEEYCNQLKNIVEQLKHTERNGGNQSFHLLLNW
jgi:uncharacterized protein YukE